MRAFKSGWIAPLGPEVEKFEKEMAEKLKVKHALALSSGTAGLHLSMILLNIQKNDYVLCPTLTFVATPNAILYCQGTPFFIDSESKSWTVDCELLEEAIKKLRKKNKKVKALISVDIYGNCCNYERIMEICENYEIPLIEDSAEALGSKYKNKYAGSFGKMSVLSFNGNKIITTSGGGMLLSNEKDLIERGRFFATQAREFLPYYEHKYVGYNYRMSNILAALGRAQLKNLEKRLFKRRFIREYYKKYLAGIEGINFIPEPKEMRSNCWLTCILIDEKKFGATAEDLRLFLEKYNIESRAIWKPMHLQPLYKDAPFLGRGVSDYLFKNGLCLPSGSSLSKRDLEKIVKLILKLKEIKKKKLGL